MSHIEYYEQKDILGYRGERVVCEHPDCRGKDKALWKLLYEVVTKPGARIPKDEEEKIERAVQQHIMNHPTHDIAIIRMKA